ncbi:hypothetical protein ACFLRA_01190 [Bdellovibrionota bacterium]
MKRLSLILTILVAFVGTSFAGDTAEEAMKYVENQLNEYNLNDSDQYRVSDYFQKINTFFDSLKEGNNGSVDDAIWGMIRYRDIDYKIERERTAADEIFMAMDDFTAGIEEIITGSSHYKFGFSSIAASMVFLYYPQHVTSFIASEREGLVHVLFKRGLYHAQNNQSFAEAIFSILNSLNFQPSYEVVRQISNAFLPFNENGFSELERPSDRDRRAEIIENALFNGRYSLSDTFSAWKFWFIENNKSLTWARMLLHKKYGKAGLSVLIETLNQNYPFAQELIDKTLSHEGNEEWARDIRETLEESGIQLPQ